jgi:16S rRNA (adenine1518-N6/adenine1519-N6)-dimethyltransferase
MEKTLKGYLRDYGRRPKKSLGQVFLIERSIQEKILELADLSPEDIVVEIGPGTGTLTRELLPRVKRLIALEIDLSLASFLQGSITSASNLNLLCADALRFDYEKASVGLGARLKVVGNLPYVISAPMMVTFLEQRKAFSLLILMVQKEVALRLTAEPGTKQYGALSVLCGFYFDLRLERHVSRNCFYPVPKVDSAVIRFVPREPVPFPPGGEAIFRDLISSLHPEISGEGLRKTLLDCDIDPRRRPETLSPEEYAQLALRMRDACPRK